MYNQNTTIPFDGSFIEFWQSGFGGVSAAEGNYFVELNASANGMLVQEPICVQPNETFSWSFAHRGRYGVDRMALVINDQDVAQFDDNNASSGTHRVVPGSIAASTTASKISTNASGWTFYQGTWTNTSSSSAIINFGFRAVSSAGGTISAGNFLDDVRIVTTNSVAGFNSQNYQGLESISTVNLPKIIISGNISIASSVQINITGGTATRGVDYTTNPATGLINVDIPAGNYDGTLATAISLDPYISIINDTTIEGDETIIIALENPSGNILLAGADYCEPFYTPISYTILEDTDGDGYANIDDLDDDNDGILDSVECNSIERVSGSDFNNNGNNVLTSSVSGWTLSGGSVWSDSNDFIQFDQDNSSRTLTQAVSSIAFNGETPVIDMQWIARNNTANITTSGVIATIAYTGTTYATISTSNSNGLATIVANNGATITGTIPTYNIGDTFPSWLTQTLTLPVTVANSGTFTITYTSDNTNDDELNLNLFSIQTCRGTDGDGIQDYLDLDSDDDDCFDAIEAAENVTQAHLTGFGSIRTNAAGTVNSNNIANIDANGVPLLVNTGGAADTGSATQGTIGQPVGSSQDASVAPCCTNPPNLNPATDFTKTGISTLEGFAGGTTGWPGNVPNGFIAIESQNKGFVITRVQSADDIPVAERVEGMLIYDMSNLPTPCVKLYNGAYWKCLEKDCGIPNN